jgi:RNA polymerase sigma factor for flagellar operon FliA
MRKEHRSMGAPVGKADDLWAKYLQTQSTQSKNDLVIHYVYLVKSIVYRMLPTYEGFSNYDDLVSCGVLGLIDAIGKFDPQRDVRFEYYASMRIRGEIIDYLRRQDWAPSSLRRKIQSVSTAMAELEQKLLRSPTDEEVAEHLQITTAELSKIVEKSHAFNVVHFEGMLNEQNAPTLNLRDPEETPEERVDNQETKRILGQLIDALPEKEKLVVTLYYYEELTLKQIAGLLGVSESRTSQIHSKVVMKLRSKMQSLLA